MAHQTSFGLSEFDEETLRAAQREAQNTPLLPIIEPTASGLPEPELPGGADETPKVEFLSESEVQMTDPDVFFSATETNSPDEGF